jgi:hypothetical protein
MAAPTYRERLRIEGAALAAAGVGGSGLLLRFAPQARRWPHSTVGQLAVLVALLVRFGPRGVNRSMADAHILEIGDEGSGEPTPLWHIPPVVAALALYFKALERVPLPGTSRAGWDASLRVTLGSALVGVAQATLLEHTVAAEEQATGRTFYRVPGSRLGRGTKLGFTPGPPTPGQ